MQVLLLFLLSVSQVYSIELIDCYTPKEPVYNLNFICNPSNGTLNPQINQTKCCISNNIFNNASYKNNNGDCIPCKTITEEQLDTSTVTQVLPTTIDNLTASSNISSTTTLLTSVIILTSSMDIPLASVTVPSTIVVQSTRLLTWHYALIAVGALIVIILVCISIGILICMCKRSSSTGSYAPEVTPETRTYRLPEDEAEHIYEVIPEKGQTPYYNVPYNPARPYEDYASIPGYSGIQCD